jgi:hypothetical protein
VEECLASGRRGDCWERLDDAVCELHAVHEIGLTAIVERISAAVARDHEA